MKIKEVSRINWIDESNILISHTIIDHEGRNKNGEYAYIRAIHAIFEETWTVFVETFGKKTQHYALCTWELYQMLREYSGI